MIFMEAWVYRDQKDRVWLSSFKPKRSKKNRKRFYIEWPKNTPKQERIRLPFISRRFPNTESEPAPHNGETRIRLKSYCMPGLERGDRKKVVFSIVPFEEVEDYCDAIDLPVGTLVTRG